MSLISRSRSHASSSLLSLATRGRQEKLLDRFIAIALSRGVAERCYLINLIKLRNILHINLVLMLINLSDRIICLRNHFVIVGSHWMQHLAITWWQICNVFGTDWWEERCWIESLGEMAMARWHMKASICLLMSLLPGLYCLYSTKQIFFENLDLRFATGDTRISLFLKKRGRRRKEFENAEKHASQQSDRVGASNHSYATGFPSVAHLDLP